MKWLTSFNSKMFRYTCFIKTLVNKIHTTMIVQLCVTVGNVIPYFEGRTQITVFENRQLIWLLIPERYDIIQRFRTLHNEKFSDFYRSLGIFKIIKPTVTLNRMCSSDGDTRNAEKMLMVRPLGELSLDRTTMRRKDNIKMNVTESGSWWKWPKIVFNGLDVCPVLLL
jgi:hypothetical protein